VTFLTTAGNLCPTGGVAIAATAAFTL